MPIGERFADVLAAAQRGDERALEELYRDLAPLVIGYLRSNGARDPEDLASEVFISLVRNVGTFTGGEESFRSWVLTITHRRLIDSFRRRSRRPEDPVLPEDVVDQVSNSTATAETEALDEIATLGVADALSTLTEDQRAVITLRILADVPIKDVAAILGKPETAVKSLQHRALASLARTMRDTEITTGQYPATERER
jgi:RNA polymerase sigma factor (sigma-70 family)